mmetsp:Transcript_38556/g.63192  ORF Transcript_38556/g.63192 Transcript_38556/m.63192 type:complete len:222 (-) Transcript_38556:283-948(-)
MIKRRRIRRQKLLIHIVSRTYNIVVVFFDAITSANNDFRFSGVHIDAFRRTNRRLFLFIIMTAFCVLRQLRLPRQFLRNGRRRFRSSSQFSIAGHTRLTLTLTLTLHKRCIVDLYFDLRAMKQVLQGLQFYKRVWLRSAVHLEPTHGGNLSTQCFIAMRINIVRETLQQMLFHLQHTLVFVYIVRLILEAPLIAIVDQLQEQCHHLIVAMPSKRQCRPCRL